jgi:hypothetical protein
VDPVFPQWVFLRQPKRQGGRCCGLSAGGLTPGRAS